MSTLVDDGLQIDAGLHRVCRVCRSAGDARPQSRGRQRGHRLRALHEQQHEQVLERQGIDCALEPPCGRVAKDDADVCCSLKASLSRRTDE